MGNAKRDDNYIPTLIAVSNADGSTPVTLYADPTTHRLLVSATSGTLDDISDVVITSGAQGDILYNNGTNWVNLAAGTSGHFLKTQGAGANPAWAAVSVTITGSDTHVTFFDGANNPAGDAGFTYNKTTDTATLAGNLKCEDLEIEDSDASHYLTITTTSNLTAGRTLTLVPGDVSRTLTISGDATISQDYSTSGNPQFATIELGHASDTTLSRSAAGTIAVEGVDVVTLSASQTLTSKTLTSPDINAGTADSLTSLSIRSTGAAFDLTLATATVFTAGRTLTIDPGDSARTLTISGNATISQDYSTTGNPQFATIELGHASDTTIARSGAGVVTIEGVEVTTNTGTQTLSNKTLTAPKFASGGFIADANGNEQIVFTTTASAVNELTVVNAATGNAPQIQATGGNTDIGITLTPKGAGIVKGELKRFMVRLLGSTTDQTVATTVGGDYRISNRAITVKAVGSYCDTAGTTGTYTIDINEAGTTIMTTNKITVDSTEKSSETAATAPAVTDSAIAADAIITFDVDAIQTTAAKGLVVWIDYVYA